MKRMRQDSNLWYKNAHLLSKQTPSTTQPHIQTPLVGLEPALPLRKSGVLPLDERGFTEKRGYR
jgi:hypothetical protein